MAVHPWWGNYIRRGAVARGLDPDAVLAIAHMEGLGGGVGDGGHAFGPFQENDAGGVLTNRPGDHRQFAESRQGIDFALDAMVPIAKGLKGQQAIAAIAKHYERPANPDKEIAGAAAAYGHVAAPAVDAPLGGPAAAPEGPLLSTGAQAASDGAAQIRAQARSALASVASGASKPADQLAKTASLMQTLKQSVPQIEPPTTQTPAPGGNGTLEGQAVALAQKYIGVKYTWGGESVKTGFDCSGLVQTVWKQLGVHVPRTTYDQWKVGKAVNDLKPGDAVFFTGSDPQGGLPGHEGMYIGGGKFIEAPGSGMHVRISDLAGRSDYVGARRFG